MPRPAALLLALAVVVPTVAAQPTAPPPRPVVAFADVEPIFAAHCVSCHGPDRQRGGLRLDGPAGVRAGGDAGANPALLLKRVTDPDPATRMPAGRPALSADQVRTLTEWVQSGARTPAGDAAAARHWAFEPIRRPASPATIDTFITAKLADNGLSLSPPADPRTLIRRLKFDLLGLPPTPEEVDTFAADRDPAAYAKLVDRYLASPHFGERWARHWLDVVRFADSHGFEMNQPRPTAYHYRDWVIAAFNADLPYDRFVREQLAGDGAGTGFLVAGPWDQVKSPDPVLTANQRADELHDLIGTAGSAFLGLTVACARCHAHKFDPIPQTDYYRLKAVFSGVQHGERPIPVAGAPDPKHEAERVGKELAVAEAELAAIEPLADPKAAAPRRAAVNPARNTERFAPVTAKFVRFVVSATNQAEPCLDELEVFTAGASPGNVALATAGAKPASSGSFPNGGSIHKLAHLNDGQYGNGRSWISNAVGRGWAEVELAKPERIDRVVGAATARGSTRTAHRPATASRCRATARRGRWSRRPTTASRSARRRAPRRPCPRATARNGTTCRAASPICGGS